jgi:hypothetical protein
MLEAPYIYLPTPPPEGNGLELEEPETLIHIFTRIRASNQEKISPSS